MTKQLPIIHKNNAVTVTTTSNSLLGRGLAAVAQTKQDIRYRQARDIYNQIIVDNWCSAYEWLPSRRFKVELLPTQGELFKDPGLQQLQPFYNLMQQLANVFIVFQELADQGYGKAYFPLASMYEGGQGISINLEKSDYFSRLAFDWCFSNQELNDPEIWTDLGWTYYIEYCTTICTKNSTPSNEQAVFWFRKAAEQGNSNAQFNLAAIYINGHDTFEQGIFWLRKAAEQGLAVAQFNLGCLYSDEWKEFFVDFADVEQEIFWLRKSTEQGLAVAQYNLGLMYEKGRGVAQDPEQAVFWYRKSAEQGHVRAQCELGSMYKNGLGVEKNYEQAKFWCWRAVEQGSVDAKNMLGVIYHTEIDEGNAKQDYEQAIFWYRMAAEQDNADAQCNLGWMYENGLGVEQDNEQAVSLYLKAAKQGNRHAKIFLKKLGINWQEK